jgi:hypothetical protein
MISHRRCFRSLLRQLQLGSRPIMFRLCCRVWRSAHAVRISSAGSSPGREVLQQIGHLVGRRQVCQSLCIIRPCFPRHVDSGRVLMRLINHSLKAAGWRKCDAAERSHIPDRPGNCWQKNTQVTHLLPLVHDFQAFIDERNKFILNCVHVLAYFLFLSF